jgi:hypothetical protein
MINIDSHEKDEEGVAMRVQTAKIGEDEDHYLQSLFPESSTTRESQILTNESNFARYSNSWKT